MKAYDPEIKYPPLSSEGHASLRKWHDEVMESVDKRTKATDTKLDAAREKLKDRLEALRPFAEKFTDLELAGVGDLTPLVGAPAIVDGRRPNKADCREAKRLVDAEETTT